MIFSQIFLQPLFRNPKNPFSSFHLHPFSPPLLFSSRAQPNPSFLLQISFRFSCYGCRTRNHSSLFFPSRSGTNSYKTYHKDPARSRIDHRIVRCGVHDVELGPTIPSINYSPYPREFPYFIQDSVFLGQNFTEYNFDSYTNPSTLKSWPKAIPNFAKRGVHKPYTVNYNYRANAKVMAATIHFYSAASNNFLFFSKIKPN